MTANKTTTPKLHAEHMNLKPLILIAIAALAFCGCTQNQCAKYVGGTATIELPPGEKLIGATWKDANLWFLTRTMRPNEKPEAYTLTEQASFGLLNGTVKVFEFAPTNTTR